MREGEVCIKAANLPVALYSSPATKPNMETAIELESKAVESHRLEQLKQEYETDVSTLRTQLEATRAADEESMSVLLDELKLASVHLSQVRALNAHLEEDLRIQKGSMFYRTCVWLVAT